MKVFFALGLTILTSAVSGAQVRGRAFAPVARPTAPIVPSKPVVQSNAGALGLFPSNASSRPLGGVALPTFPANTAFRHGGHRPTPARYIGPVYYVPNAFDTSYEYASDVSATGPAPQAENYAAPPPPRFSRTQSTSMPQQESAAPADENYYLIAYKNHSVYSAKSYWLEGETLHYITLQDTHNQASLAFIDQEETAKLNADRQ